MAKIRTVKSPGPLVVRKSEEFVGIFNALRSGGHYPHVRVIWPVGKGPSRHVLLAIYVEEDCHVHYVVKVFNAAVALTCVMGVPEA